MEYKSTVLFYFLFCLIIRCCKCHISDSHGLNGQHSTMPSRFDILSNVLNFCEANGKKYISITSISIVKNNMSLREHFIMLSLSQRRKMYLKYVPFDKAVEEVNIREIESKIILVSYETIQSNQTIVEDVIHLISHSKIRSSILVITKLGDRAGADEVSLEPIVLALSNLQQNLFFYIVYDHLMKNGSKEFAWTQVITLQNNPKVILNNLLFDSESRIKER